MPNDISLTGFFGHRFRAIPSDSFAHRSAEQLPALHLHTYDNVYLSAGYKVSKKRANAQKTTPCASLQAWFAPLRFFFRRCSRIPSLRSVWRSSLFHRMALPLASLHSSATGAPLAAIGRLRSLRSLACYALQPAAYGGSRCRPSMAGAIRGALLFISSQVLTTIF